MKDPPYGAVGDGSTDDSTAFRAALSSVPSAGGALYIPPGSYKASLTVTGREDVMILGAGTGSIIKPASGTAITIAQCHRVHVMNLQLSGGNGGATGLDITGDFDARFVELYIAGFSGDGIHVDGDDENGLEATFTDVTCRGNGGFGYHLTRATTTDRGGVYLNNLRCNSDGTGAGGIKIESSSAGACPVFHSFVSATADGYSGVPSLWLKNVAQCHFVQSWFGGNNATGATVLMEGGGWLHNLTSCYLVNGSSAAGTSNIAVAGTVGALIFNDLIFDGTPAVHVHVTSTGANFLLGQYHIGGGTPSPITDTPTALFNRTGYIDQDGPTVFVTKGDGRSQCVGFSDPQNVGKEIWLRNNNGAFQLINQEFTSPNFRVDNSGFIWLGGDVRLQGNGSGPTLLSGSGPPKASTGADGDFYFRTDTPGTARQRIYVKSSGAWVGIV